MKLKKKINKTVQRERLKMEPFSSELPYRIHDWLIISLKDICIVIRKSPTFLPSRYMYKYNIDTYSNINSSIKLLSTSTEQVAIMNNLSNLISVKSGSHDINGINFNEVNDLMHHIGLAKKKLITRQSGE